MKKNRQFISGFCTVLKTAILLLVFSPGTEAQNSNILFNQSYHDGGTAMVFFSVFDQDGSPVSDAHILINEEILLFSDEWGFASVELFTGFYIAEISKEGHESVTLEFVVDEGDDLGFEVLLPWTESFPPIIFCPEDITVANDPGLCGAFDVDLGEPMVEDPSGDVGIFHNAPEDGFPVGTTIVTWTAVNAAGQSSSCEQLVTVEDVEPPVISPKPDITVDNDAGECGAHVFWDPPAASDNCEVDDVQGSHSPGDFSPIGPTSVIYTAMDVHGNPSYSGFIVEVIDVEPPEISPLPDITVDNDAGECGAHVFWDPPAASDNCEVDDVQGSHSPGDFFPIGPTSVIYTAMDVHGNPSYSGFIVEVIDVEPPIIEQLPDVGVFAEPGEEGAFVSWETPEVTDNCGVEFLTGSHEPGYFFPIGNTSVTYSAEDIHGNASSMEFQVSVIIIDPDIPELVDVSGLFTNEDGEICTAALQTIIVSETDLETGAHLELVAGENILFKPGVQIQAGAYLHAYIDMDGTFCGDLTTLLTVNEEELLPDDKTNEVITGLPVDDLREINQDLFKVYPNPTGGRFTLELVSPYIEEGINVHIFGLHGGMVFQEKLPAQPKNFLDLTGHHPGLYFIRVIVGDHTLVERLIIK